MHRIKYYAQIKKAFFFGKLLPFDSCNLFRIRRY